MQEIHDEKRIESILRQESRIDQGDRSAGLLSGVVGSIRVPSGTHSQM